MARAAFGGGFGRRSCELCTCTWPGRHPCNRQQFLVHGFMDVAMSRENVHSRCEVRTGFEQTSHAVPVRTGISYSQGQGARNHCECCQNHTVDEIGERTVWCATSRSRVSTVTVGLLDLGCQVAKVHSYWQYQEGAPAAVTTDDDTVTREVAVW